MGAHSSTEGCQGATHAGNSSRSAPADLSGLWPPSPICGSGCRTPRASLRMCRATGRAVELFTARQGHKCNAVAAMAAASRPAHEKAIVQQAGIKNGQQHSCNARSATQPLSRSPGCSHGSHDRLLSIPHSTQGTACISCIQSAHPARRMHLANRKAAEGTRQKGKASWAGRGTVLLHTANE